MKRTVGEILVIILGALLISSSFNLLLIPHQLLSGGVSGIAMLVGYFTDWNIGILYFIFNLPLIVWGLLVIGRRFVVLSVVSVIFTTWFMQLVPVVQVTSDAILGAVFGGVLIGLGTGISLRAGGSTGGFDIVGSIITRKHDFPLGTFLFVLNGVVIIALGYFKDNWDLALYSMLSMYITGKLVDTIHIRYVKVTAFIVTHRQQEMLDELVRLPRGVTVMETEGGYTKSKHCMLMTVTTRYELAELKRIVRETDPKAFVNVVETAAVWGEFRRNL
ncbi:membrane protein [Paenibacillus sp. J31TS4]|uniref:YitT family protein n=1 Tax=Paenibacillus sp. J31TS4 TaxID=2807195 RepID=UPI001B1D7841|nr:YitT family protein [Paenibacillus sp. J31TS4]GIP38018.1 membrane protein [Paenibacillus sp. J31TS4]